MWLDRPTPPWKLGGEFKADPFGAYTAELRAIRLNPGRTSMLRLYLGEHIFTFEERVAMVAAHEAMHAVQHAAGDPAPPSCLPHGSLRPDYATCRHERAARLAAWAYVCARWPARRAPVLDALRQVDLSTSRVPEVIEPMLAHPDPPAFAPRARGVLSWSVVDRDLVLRHGEAWATVRDKAEDWLWRPLVRSRVFEPRYPLGR